MGGVSNSTRLVIIAHSDLGRRVLVVVVEMLRRVLGLALFAQFGPGLELEELLRRFT